MERNYTRQKAQLEVIKNKQWKWQENRQRKQSITLNKAAQTASFFIAFVIIADYIGCSTNMSDKKRKKNSYLPRGEPCSDWVRRSHLTFLARKSSRLLCIATKGCHVVVLTMKLLQGLICNFFFRICIFFYLWNFFPVTRFLVTPLLVTRYSVTLFSNTPLGRMFLHVYLGVKLDWYVML